MNRLQTLWIDGVGGYAMCDQDVVVIGGNRLNDSAKKVSEQGVALNADQEQHVRVMADLPSQAARLHRSGEDRLLEPLVSLSVNGVVKSGMTLLRENDTIEFVNGVKIHYRRPTALSTTVCLRLLSRHRWSDSIDGVLLLGDSCVLGPMPQAHVHCRHWQNEIVLFRKQSQWMYRSLSVANTVRANVSSTVHSHRTTAISDRAPQALAAATPVSQEVSLAKEKPQLIEIGQRIVGPDYSMTWLGVS